MSTLNNRYYTILYFLNIECIAPPIRCIFYAGSLFYKIIEVLYLDFFIGSGSCKYIQSLFFRICMIRPKQDSCHIVFYNIPFHILSQCYIFKIKV